MKYLRAVPVLLALLAGCNENTAPTASHDPHAAEAESIAAALAKLSPEERAVAEAQKMCPIGNAPLGSMGVPIKVDVGGKPVFICCEGCRSELLARYEKHETPAPETAEQAKPN